MAERFKAPVLRTGVAAMSPWVRIPLSPPECIDLTLFGQAEQLPGIVERYHQGATSGLAI